jgi:hypothetical protein
LFYSPIREGIVTGSQTAAAKFGQLGPITPDFGPNVANRRGKRGGDASRSGADDKNVAVSVASINWSGPSNARTIRRLSAPALTRDPEGQRNP